MLIEINEKWIRALEPSSMLEPGQERVILWDASQKGLGLVVHKSGTLAWVLRYSLQGRPGKVTLGQWPDLPYDAAKKKAQRLRGHVADGIDPNKTKDGGVTFKDLVKRLRLDYYPGLKPSTVRTYNLLLDHHILPRLGKIMVDEVGLADVAKLHHKMRAQPRTANQALAVVARGLHMAETWGLREPNTNPCPAIQRYPEVKRERYLTQAELAELGARLRSMVADWNPYTVAALRFSLLTGMRKGEITSLKWGQVQGDRLVLLHHKTEKTAGTKTIHLAEPAIKILEGLDRVLGCPYVFAGEAGGTVNASLRGLWDRLREGTTFADVRVHDLRHTFASIGIMEGLTLEQIGGLLGHRAAATTKRYAHLMEEAAKKAASTTAGAVVRGMG